MIRKEQVVVLAGGMGTRLGKVSQSCAKILLPVDRRAFLYHLIDPLVSQGYRRFHFCLGHLAQQVVSHLERLPPEFEWTFQADPTPRGTGGALRAAGPMIDDQFLLVLGDTYLDAPFPDLFRQLGPSVPAAMLVTSKPSGVTPNVRVSNGKVVQYSKGGVQPESPADEPLTDTGAAAFSRSCLRLVADVPAPFGLEVLFQRLIARGELAAVVTSTRFYDIGTPAGYDAFADDFAGW